MDTTIVELEAPHRIVEHGRGGRAQPDPVDHGLGADRGPGLADHGPRLPLDRAPNPSTAALEVLCGGSVWLERGWREALRRLRDARGRRRRRRAGRRRRRQPSRDRHPLIRVFIDSRRRWPAARRLLLPLLARSCSLALVGGVSACGYSSDSQGRRRGRAGRSSASSSTPSIFSRFLNPNDNEDSAYLVGQPPPPKAPPTSASSSKSRTRAKRPQTLRRR